MKTRVTALGCLLLGCFIAASAQTPADPQPPSILSQAAGSTYDRRDSLGNINVYLPELQASIRLRKLIRNVLFESQIDYKFVTGDISTFLRYKYYAKNFTYRIGIFDTIEFPEVGSSSTVEFERVRGGLLLFGMPRDYNNRYFWLLQDDRLTFGDLTKVDNKKNNVYTKVGYQFGTQFDERLNAIVGESRGRITPVLTAFREIGPQKTGFAAAVTQSVKLGCKRIKDTPALKQEQNCTADYRYTKLEAEALHRFDVSARTFVFTRLHFGSFFGEEKLTGRDDNPEFERYSIPRYELFRLNGREALRSLKTSDYTQGSREIHMTNEFFAPIFRNRDYKMGPLHWNTLYGIAYLGAGTVGFKTNQLTKFNDAVADAGIGTEASITVRDFDVLLSVLYAHTIKAPCDDPTVSSRCLTGGNLKFSLRTVR